MDTTEFFAYIFFRKQSKNKIRSNAEMQQFSSNFYFWTTYDSFAEKHSLLMTRIDQFALKIQKAKKYPWGET